MKYENGTAEPTSSVRGCYKLCSKRYNHPQTNYTTVNANKKLTDGFRNATRELPIRIEFIEAMLAARAGLDTIHSDWFEILPQMIEITNNAFTSGRLEALVKEEFLNLISSSFTVLKDDGYMIVNHFQYQYDLDLGIHPDFCENLLLITRRWIQDAGLGQEISVEGFSPQWWMFLKKV